MRSTIDIGIWYPKCDNFELICYSDADFGGCKIDRKGNSGTCQFLSHLLVSWHSKKQNYVTLSTAEAKYIVARLGCAQVLWKKQTLSDFGLTYSHLPIKCDNTSAINISKNPVQHSKTNHIEIRHYFLRDHAQKKDITLELLEPRTNLRTFSQNPLTRNNLLTFECNYGLLLCNFVIKITSNYREITQIS